MAAPYLVAMEHAEWNANRLIQRRHQKRPLGYMERKYNFNPPQPVLSCRSVAVDLTGTRTYRARSANDIIEEQHKLIHTVYTKARTIASAPPSKIRAKPAPSPPKQAHRVISSIKVEGARPKTAPSTRSPGTNQGAAAPKLLKRRVRSRPGTASEIVQSTNQSKFCSQDDPEIIHSARSFHKVNRLIREQWDDDNHDISEGIFVRGRKKEGGSSLDPKTGNQWLSFAGSQADKNTGVVEAFTSSAMKGQGDFYTIDGSNGSLVAKQLRHGDNIRIGINGKSVAHDIGQRRSKHQKHSACGDTDSDDRSDQEKSVVPLCWTDQMSKPDAKVVQASKPPSNKPLPCLSETHPVVYSDDTTNEHHRSRMNGKEGYRVKAKSKSCVGMDGRASSTVTSLSISCNNSDSDDDQISYEAILQMQLSLSRQETLERGIEKARIMSGQRGQSDSENVNSNDLLMKSGLSGEGVKKERVGPYIDVSVPGCLSRPTTAFSGTNQEADIEHLVVRVGNATPCNIKSPPSRGPSAGRPPPAKPQLHRSSTAARMNIQGRSSSSLTGGSVEAEFIQFARGMAITEDPSEPVKKPDIRPSSSGASSLRPSSAVLPDNTLECHTINIVRSPTPPAAAPQEEVIEKPSTPIIPHPPSNTPPASPTASPSIHYAFNIPTGQQLDHDGSSAADTGDR